MKTPYSAVAWSDGQRHHLGMFACAEAAALRVALEPTTGSLAPGRAPKRRRPPSGEQAPRKAPCVLDEEAEDEGVESDSDVYVVDKILDSRCGRGGITEYLCRWEGWAAEHDTWEPAHHIIDKRLIKDFESAQAAVQS